VHDCCDFYRGAYCCRLSDWTDTPKADRGLRKAVSELIVPEHKVRWPIHDDLMSAEQTVSAHPFSRVSRASSGQGISHWESTTSGQLPWEHTYRL